MTSVDAVNANYYNATTKNGAPYRKTNANKKAGATIGAIGAASLIGYEAKVLTNLVRIEQPGAKFLTVLKDYLKAKPLSTIGRLGKAAVIGLVVGAVADAIVNKVRRNKADKAFKTNLNQTV